MARRRSTSKTMGVMAVAMLLVVGLIAPAAVAEEGDLPEPEAPEDEPAEVEEAPEEVQAFDAELETTEEESQLQHCPGSDSGAPSGAIDGASGSITDAGGVEGLTISWSDRSVAIDNDTDTDVTVEWCAKGGRNFDGSNPEGGDNDAIQASQTIGSQTTEVSAGAEVEAGPFGTDISYFVLYNVTVDEPEVNFCDPSERPSGQSIAEWHEANNFDGSTCFDYEVTEACGSVDVKLTENESSLSYTFRYAEGTEVPEDPDGDGGFPATFEEGYNDGEVTLTFYIVGPESDFFRLATEDGDFPNWWNRVGETVTIDTNCEDEPEPDATIVFQKLVCDSYDDVRFNEDVTGGRDDTGGARDAVDDPWTLSGNVEGPELKSNCAPAAGWDFTAQVETQPGQADELGEYNYGDASVTPEGATDSDGLLEVKLSELFVDGDGEVDQASIDAIIEDNKQLWISENQQDGFGFGALQCHTDVLNNDNLEFIQGVADGDTVYCVAWNVQETDEDDVWKLWFNEDGELITGDALPDPEDVSLTIDVVLESENSIEVSTANDDFEVDSDKGIGQLFGGGEGYNAWKAQVTFPASDSIDALNEVSVSDGDRNWSQEPCDQLLREEVGNGGNGIGERLELAIEAPVVPSLDDYNVVCNQEVTTPTNGNGFVPPENGEDPEEEPEDPETMVFGAQFGQECIADDTLLVTYELDNTANEVAGRFNVVVDGVERQIVVRPGDTFTVEFEVALEDGDVPLQVFDADGELLAEGSFNAEICVPDPEPEPEPEDETEVRDVVEEKPLPDQAAERATEVRGVALQRTGASALLLALLGLLGVGLGGGILARKRETE